MLIIINWVYRPEQRSSGEKTKVSTFILQPASNGMKEICQRHGSNKLPPPVLIQNQFIHYYIHVYAVKNHLWYYQIGNVLVCVSKPINDNNQIVCNHEIGSCKNIVTLDRPSVLFTSKAGLLSFLLHHIFLHGRGISVCNIAGFACEVDGYFIWWNRCSWNALLYCDIYEVAHSTERYNHYRHVKSVSMFTDYTHKFMAWYHFISIFPWRRNCSMYCNQWVWNIIYKGLFLLTDINQTSMGIRARISNYIE